MYSVMIVDDEITIRENLPRAINFENHGFTVCGTAKNGQDALDLLPVLQPDVVMLDVRMPVMDGLAFLKQLRQGSYRDLQVIILSGYSDFEYAKKAMEYGVRGYLTKPVDENEAAAHLDEIAHILQARGAEQHRINYQKDLRIMKRAYNQNGPLEATDKYVGLHIILKSVRNASSETHPYQVITQIAAEHIGLGDECLLVHRGCFYSFLLVGSTDNVSNNAEYTQQLVAKLAAVQLDCLCIVDAPLLQNDVPEFRSLVLQSLYRLFTPLFYAGASPPAGDITQGVPENSAPTREKIEQTYDNLRRSMTELNEPQAAQDMQRLFEIVREAALPIEEVFNVSHRIYFSIIELMNSLCDGESEQAAIHNIDWQDATIFIDFDKWRELQLHQLTDAFVIIRQNRKLRGFGISNNLLEYIYANYCSPFTLQQVATHFHMNPAYLGRVFQKATGQSFKQYVNNLRIAEAKRLLQNSDKMIYAIAEELGFSESSYFIAKFTKEVGTSPQEFRKRQ